MIGNTASELGWLTVDQHQRLREELEAEGRIASRGMTIRTKSGSQLEGLLQGERIMIGGKPYLLTVTIDITARRRSEGASISPPRSPSQIVDAAA